MNKKLGIGIVAILIVVILTTISIQSTVIAVRNERLRCIEKLARHQNVLDPWAIIDIITGVSD